jgi:hypothetical protein
MDKGGSDSDVFRLEEYKALRTEIANKQSSIERIILSTIAGNFAIYSFGLTGKPAERPLCWLVALIPALVSGVACSWITKNVRSCENIANYIRLEIEKNVNGLHWETTLADRRLLQRKPEFWRLLVDPSKLIVVFVLFVVGSPVLSLLLLGDTGVTQGVKWWTCRIIAIGIAAVSSLPILGMWRALRDQSGSPKA